MHQFCSEEKDNKKKRTEEKTIEEHIRTKRKTLTRRKSEEARRYSIILRDFKGFYLFTFFFILFLSCI